MVWEQGMDLTQPLRALLKDAATLFPADMTTLVQVGVESVGQRLGWGGLGSA